MNLSLKQKTALTSYIANGCDADATIKKFPGKLTKQTLTKYINSDAGKSYISEINNDIEAVLKINKVKIVGEYLGLYAEAREDITKTGNLAKGCLDSICKTMSYDAPQQVEVSVDLSTWLIKQQTPKQIEVQNNTEVIIDER